MIDLRTLLPFDIETIWRRCKKTGRVVVVHEAPQDLRLRRRARGARSRRRRSCHLEAPILRVTGFDTPFPYTLEHEYLPDARSAILATRVEPRRSG